MKQAKKPNHEPVASMRQINMRVPAYLITFIEDERRRLGLRASNAVMVALLENAWLKRKTKEQRT